MDKGTIFEVARDIVRKETVSVSIKQFNDYFKKSSEPARVSVTKVKSSRKKLKKRLGREKIN